MIAGGVTMLLGWLCHHLGHRRRAPVRPASVRIYRDGQEYARAVSDGSLRRKGGR